MIPFCSVRKVRLPSGQKIYLSFAGPRRLRRFHRTRGKAESYGPAVLARLARARSAGGAAG